MNLTNLYELQLIDTQLRSITEELFSIEEKLKQDKLVLSAQKTLAKKQET